MFLVQLTFILTGLTSFVYLGWMDLFGPDRHVSMSQTDYYTGIIATLTWQLIRYMELPLTSQSDTLTLQ